MAPATRENMMWFRISSVRRGVGSFGIGLRSSSRPFPACARCHGCCEAKVRPPGQAARTASIRATVEGPFTSRCTLPPASPRNRDRSAIPETAQRHTPSPRAHPRWTATTARFSFVIHPAHRLRSLVVLHTTVGTAGRWRATAAANQADLVIATSDSKGDQFHQVEKPGPMTADAPAAHSRAPMTPSIRPSRSSSGSEPWRTATRPPRCRPVWEASAVRSRTASQPGDCLDVPITIAGPRRGGAGQLTPDGNWRSCKVRLGKSSTTRPPNRYSEL